MAFKMKGSAFKLGNVATKSALKQWAKAKGGKKHPKAEKSSPVKDYSQNAYHSLGDSLNPDAHPHQERERGPDGLVKPGAKVKKKKRKEAKDKTAVPMKSPLEQGKTKLWDKVKAFGTAVTSKQGLMTPGNAAIKKAYSKYKREKKKYRDADRKSEMNK
jgi:hypothetical protein